VIKFRVVGMCCLLQRKMEEEEEMEEGERRVAHQVMN
jgi:hypothetical protein